MWPPPPASRTGRKLRTPCTTPQRFTPTTHSHDSIGPNHALDFVATPALLQTTSTRPNRSTAASASACTDAASLTSVVTARVATPLAATRSAAARQPGLVDVGQDDVEATVSERSGQGQPDPAGRTGDRGDLAGLEEHQADGSLGPIPTLSRNSDFQADGSSRTCSARKANTTSCHTLALLGLRIQWFSSGK